MGMQSTSRPQNDKYQNMGDGNDEIRSWHILSIISWSLMLVTIWVSYEWGFCIWSYFQTYIERHIEYRYFPMNCKYYLLYIYTFLISVLAFGVYIVYHNM